MVLAVGGGREAVEAGCRAPGGGKIAGLDGGERVHEGMIYHDYVARILSLGITRSVCDLDARIAIAVRSIVHASSTCTFRRDDLLCGHRTRPAMRISNSPSYAYVKPAQ